jgi:hypothetical protein
VSHKVDQLLADYTVPYLTHRRKKLKSDIVIIYPLKKEAMRSSEKLINFYRNTRRHIPVTAVKPSNPTYLSSMEMVLNILEMKERFRLKGR